MTITLREIQAFHYHLAATNQSYPARIDLSSPRSYGYDKNALITALARVKTKVIKYHDEILSLDVNNLASRCKNEDDERLTIWLLKRLISIILLGNDNPVLSIPQQLRIHLGGIATLIYRSEIGIRRSQQSQESERLSVRYRMFYDSHLPIVINEMCPEAVDLLANEYLVGLKLNKLRHYIRNFGYVYGIGRDDEFVPHSDTESIAYVRNASVTTHQKLYTEYIPGITLREFLSDATVSQFKVVMIQLLYALTIAYDHCSFVHHRLHLGNVIVNKRDDIMVLNYHLPDGTDRMIVTNHLAVITDYKTATTNVNHPLVDILSLSGNVVNHLINTTNQRLLPSALALWHLLVNPAESRSILDQLSHCDFYYPGTDSHCSTLIRTIEQEWNLSFSVPLTIPTPRQYHINKMPLLKNIVINYQLQDRKDHEFKIADYQLLYDILESSTVYCEEMFRNLLRSTWNDGYTTIHSSWYDDLLLLIQHLEDNVISTIIIGIHLDTTDLVNRRRLTWANIFKDLYPYLRKIDANPAWHPPYYSLIRPLLFTDSLRSSSGSSLRSSSGSSLRLSSLRSSSLESGPVLPYYP